MPWAKEHRKQKFAELDRRRRSKRRSYFNNYYHEKIKTNPLEMEKSRIRLATRYKYGKAKECNICGSKDRVTHHHYTEPYEIDKFIDVCEYHHIILDYTKRYKKEVNNGRANRNNKPEAR